MNIDIVGIGNQIMEYPDPKTCEFEDTPDDYIRLAKKVIGHFGKYYGNTATQMLSSDDAISNVATAIMFADWRWSAEHKNEAGTVRSKKAYRNQCGIWAIHAWINRASTNKQMMSLSYKPTASNEDSYDIIPDNKAENPATIVAREEQQVIQSKLLAKILDNDYLSDREKDVIRMYYLKGMTLEDIGKQFKVTRKRIHQNLKKGLDKLKELAKELC